MSHLYNEIEANAAEWLENLMLTGEIPEGKIDARSIKLLNGRDFDGVTQFHTFAGIGGWPLALKLAGWPEDKEVWTGSCPCQPYSSAGKQEGNSDPRNLWPAFFALIKERRPQYIFGEQVASAIKHGWLDRVYADLEGIGYTVGSAVLGAHSAGANHIRQRLYWGAARGAEHAAGVGRLERGAESGERGLERGCGGGGVADKPVGDSGRERDERRGDAGDVHGAASGVQGEARERQRDGDASGDEGATRGLAQDPRGLRRRGRDVRRDEGDSGELEPQGEVAGLGVGGGLPNNNNKGLEVGGEGRPESNGSAVSGPDGDDGRVDDHVSDRERGRELGSEGNPAASGEEEMGEDIRETTGRTSPWSDFRLVLCSDGKARRTGARVFPLAYGLPRRDVDQSRTWRKGLARGASKARIGMLKGSGNAIVPDVAAEFIMAFRETVEGL